MGKNNLWYTGMMGVVIGDALGSPVQFKDRAVVKRNPVSSMVPCVGFGTPAGSWTDDSSMALATLDSFVSKNGYDLCDIADKFVDWLEYGKYTPLGQAYDVGIGCQTGILRYRRSKDPYTSGGDGERDNGNGSLMRIMPACLFFLHKLLKKEMSEEECVKGIEDVSGITHRHIRSKLACTLYFYMVKNIVCGRGKASLQACLEEAVAEWKSYYGKDISNLTEMAYYGRIFDMNEFKNVPEHEISTSGYVVHTLEAVVWNLLTTDSFKSCLIQAVNLGDDADTVGAITGGLAAIYYGADSIPGDWVKAVVDMKLEIQMFEKADEMFDIG